MTRFKFFPNWEKEIEDLPKVKEYIAKKAKRASSLAQRQFSVTYTGAYAKSHVYDETSFGNTDSAAFLVEFGYGATPPYHVLALAAVAAGMEFEPEGGTLS